MGRTSNDLASGRKAASSSDATSPASEAVESTPSLWKVDALPSRGPLERNETCDVCIVGAGISGLSAAYELSQRGKQVIVLDAHEIGMGETAQTTAHLASALDDRFSEIEKAHGERGARLAYESHARAIDHIEGIAAQEAIDCEFVRLPGYLFLGPESSERLLDDELDAARRAGFPGVERLGRAPVESFDTGPCLVFPNQARFHPLRYLKGMAAAVERRGGRIFSRTFVSEVKGGKRPELRTRSGLEVHAGAIIVATNSPFHIRWAIHSKQAPYRTYAIALEVPEGSVEDALYWDTSDPYHYIRLAKATGGFAHLIVGGEDHRTGKANDGNERYRRLERWARERFPMARDVMYRWSGQVLEPFDYLAFIGRDPTGERNIYLATGDSGHGMTHGAIAGTLLADLIAGRDNPWSDLYDPSRKTTRAAREYVRENAGVAAEYAKWLKPETPRRWQVLAPGEGAVIQRGGRKIAMYRDADGDVHERSAVCTHLGCTVRWNSDAKSWDCACHGSRFAPTGEVLNGPAQGDLHPIDSSRPPASLLRAAIVGAGGGMVATLAMSALLVAAKKLGLVGELPPKKLVRGIRRRAGIASKSRRSDDVLAVLSHWAYGMAGGAVFGVLHRRPSSLRQSSAAGAAFGTAVWAASYYGRIPAVGLMRPPRRDRPGRQPTMVAAHLLYGSLLGALVDQGNRSLRAD